MNKTKNESILDWDWNIGSKFYWITNEFGIINKFNGEITEKHSDHLIGVVGVNKDITVWIDNDITCDTNQFIRVGRCGSSIQEPYIHVKEIEKINNLLLSQSWVENEYNGKISYMTYDVSDLNGNILQSFSSITNARKFANKTVI